MPLRDAPFDPADYADAEAQLGLLNDALNSHDVAFVAAALKTVLEARGMDALGIGLDPRLSNGLATFDTLGMDVLATYRSS